MGLRAGSSRLLLLSACKHSFKMRRLFFARDDADFNFLEAGLLQPAMQVAFRKAKPAVTVKFARALEAVREQIEDHDLSARAQGFVSGGNRLGRLFRMMQRLAENGQIDAFRFHRRVLEIPQTKLQVL